METFPVMLPLKSQTLQYFVEHGITSLNPSQLALVTTGGVYSLQNESIVGYPHCRNFSNSFILPAECQISVHLFKLSQFSVKIPRISLPENIRSEVGSLKHKLFFQDQQFLISRLKYFSFSFVGCNN